MERESSAPRATESAPATPTIFVPVLLGSDLSIYSLAQLIHRTWGYASYTISELPRGPINKSAIIRQVLLGEITDPDQVYSRYCQAINEIAERHRDLPVVVIPNNDAFVAHLDRARSAGDLADNVIAAVGPAPAIYQACDKAHLTSVLTELGLPVMADVELATDASAEQWRAQLATITFPVVMKSADGGTTYAHLDFPGMKKVYHARTSDEAIDIMERVAAGGYRGSMLAQELIRGDDTYSWVISGYIDSHDQVTMGVSAQVVVNLHQPSLMGNAAALLTTRNDELIDHAIAVVRRLGLRGCFTIDVKIDAETSRAYILDINTRIGRSCYHLWAAGVNPVENIIADLVENRSLPERRNSREALYAIIPLPVALRYASSSDLRSRMLRAIATGRVYHPLSYRRDIGPYRLFYRQAQSLNYARKLINDYPRQTDSGF